ncbi:MAG: NAD(P)H-hydrate epimerase, partial [Chloroflexota bacterium]|nr:NAD(P)H-hydrate epimerase [Chloroflexota bacterium]
MKIVTAAQMRRIEADAFESGREDPAGLMRRAGQAVARAALAALPRPAEARALVLVGPGNNGGDGLIVAEALLMAGLPAVAVWLYRRGDVGNAPVVPALLERVQVVPESPGAGLAAALAGADLIVDAVYGIGAREGLPGDLAAALEAVNSRGREPGVIRVALDIPTGVDADSGAADPAAFRADLTVTLGRPKRGLYLPPGLRHTGRVVVEPLDLDDGGVPDDAPRLIGRADAARLLPRREADAHKGDAGSLMIVGGSANYLGAPVLSANAALRAGAGLVTVAVPAGILGAVASQVPEATYLALPEAGFGVAGPDAAPVIAGALDRYTALQIGNGIGRAPGTAGFLARLFGLDPVGAGGRLAVPVLFDADGLNWLSTVDRWWEALRGLDIVLTPHPGEMGRLRGGDTVAVTAAPWDAARDAAREWGQTVLLKGGHSVVATPDGGLWVAPLA